MSHESLNTTELDAPLKQIIYEAGTFARKEFLNFSSNDIEYKGKNDLFSYVDVQTERILKDRCRELLPGSGFINEESENEPGTNGYQWIIDPIDGTTNFVHGVPFFSISLALYKGEEAHMGYVYHVMADELFWAIRGRGAFCNDQPIEVRSTPELAHAILATGFPFKDFSWADDYFQMLKIFMERSHGLRRIGSAALDLAFVAAGRFDGFFEYGLNPWDLAAGALLVTEAGGTVTDFDGGNSYVFGGQLISSNGRIHPEMQEVIAKGIGQNV
ncbi:MAG: inositol monophosphatase family protein [Bacteroidota bacterium]